MEIKATPATPAGDVTSGEREWEREWERQLIIQNVRARETDGSAFGAHDEAVKKAAGSRERH